ncbi:lipopolysaccharide biosynthesis protein [Telluribacter humicola]|uniref:lipopolysaccharide biosynthesis protein n=1 Tax=Telluribacter humicola TaxID=1720261 RepID=UPI001A959F7D|nr:lipopolysaccharide biosynthesis protein [Telluribacter humicola]
MKKQILLNTVSAVLTKAGKLAVGLLTVPLFLNTLGKEGYGFVILLSVVISLSALLEFGIRAGLVRYYTKSLVNKAYDEFNRYMSTALVMYFLVWLTIALVLLAAGDRLLIETFNISAEYQDDVMDLILFYILPIVYINFTIPILGAVLSSLHRFDIVNYRDLVVTILTFPAYYIALVTLDTGVWGWVWVSLGLQLLHLVILLFVVKRLVPSTAINLRGLRSSYFKDIFSFGVITFIGSMSRRMKIDADPLLISAFSAPAAVSLYRSGVSMPGHTRPIISSFSGQIYTFATAVHERGETEKLNRLFDKGTKYTLLLGVVMLCFFLFLSDAIVYVWLHNSLSPADLELVSLCMKGMAIIDFCFYLEGTSYSILYGINRLKKMAYTDFFLGLLNIASTALLLYYSGGFIPLALLPTIILEAIARPIYLYYTAGVIGYSRKGVWTNIYLPVSLCLGTCAGTMYLFFLIAPGNDSTYWTVLLTGTALLVVVWTISCYLLAFNQNEKREVQKALVSSTSYIRHLWA